MPGINSSNVKPQTIPGSIYLFFSFQIKKTKNIAHDPFRNKTGRIHMERQDYSKLQTRKVKAFKSLKKEKAEADK